MPWCPKCRNEYKDGYTVCSDCGCELVDELGPEMTVAYFGTEEEIGRIVEFLKANDIEGAEARYNEEDKQYELWVVKDDNETVKLALRTYFKKVLPEMMKENSDEDSDEDFDGEYSDEENSDEGETEDGDDVPKECASLQEENVYVKPADRAVEYKSGAATLFLVGIVGAIVLILADLEVINFPMYGAGKILINVVLGGMFAAFIVLGFTSAASYRKLKDKATSDEKAEEDIEKWFDENVQKEEITSLDNEDETEEAKYFNRIAFIKKKISDNFPESDPSFVDYIAEKLYAKTFE